MAFVRNAYDEQSLVNYWRGPAELEDEVAARMIAKGHAVPLDEAELNNKKMDDLVADASAMGVDVSDASKKEDVVKKMVGKK